MSAGTENAAIPTPDQICQVIKTCIATLFCQKCEKQKLGKNVDMENRTLKTLYLACNIKIWEDIGEDFSKLYCQVPQCLNL